jgi:hypothetical protein
MTPQRPHDQNTSSRPSILNPTKNNRSWLSVAYKKRKRRRPYALAKMDLPQPEGRGAKAKEEEVLSENKAKSDF